MNKMTMCGFGVLVLLASPTALFAQGSTQSPPSPNASSNSPSAPGSVPSGARTLPPGTTGTQQMGTVGTTRVEPAPTGPASGGAPGLPQPGTSTSPR